ncbi:sulfotransferase [Sphingorhabdus pulchriflava]|uniref:Sulfotransferase n=1 Tax=Sphingorhabdus pulchriflava TaxID=2292257 RepID=A0A371BFD0_9SPHN|nr:sulfotransferase [Sphingorhabdus pulchriflava]RDV06316.1 sulfotransferase [Sphingorhabdus pulchriflava]
MRSGFAASFDQLHEEAIEATGLNDFGDPVYREGLEALLAARDASGIDYPADGETILGPLRQTLAARLKSIDQIKRMGAALASVEQPLFILGLPRTGTTAMQRMLMSDPQLQGLEYWLGAAPKPRPARESWDSDPEFIACRDGLEAMMQAAPLIGKMHPMAADEGEECRLVMEQSFGHSSFSLVAPIRPYQDWLFQADLEPHYRHFKSVLGLIGSNDREKTWVLKCPHHAPQVDSLLRAFPDSRILFMHRPVEDVVPSVVRLGESFLGMVEGDGIDMVSRAEMIVENLDLTLRRLLKVRDDNPDRFLNLSMESFVADPMASVERIYSHFGLAMSSESRTALSAWVRENHHGGHGAPGAGPLPFGLNRDALRERFNYYQG